MKNLKYIVIICIVIIGCYEQPKQKKSNHAKMILERHDNGSEKIVHQYFKDTASFEDNYNYIEYYDNSQVKVIGLENRSNKIGLWKYYHKNGNIKAKVNFKLSTLIGSISVYKKNGKLNGIDTIENQLIKNKNFEVEQFLKSIKKTLKNKPIWLDSLKLLTDSIRNIENGL